MDTFDTEERGTLKNIRLQRFPNYREVYKLLEKQSDQPRRGCVPMFVIYDSPEEFPGKFVVRLCDMCEPSPYYTVSDTLEEARATMPKCMTWIGRSIYDVRSLVETWI